MAFRLAPGGCAAVAPVIGLVALAGCGPVTTSYLPDEPVEPEPTRIWVQVNPPAVVPPAPAPPPVAPADRLLPARIRIGALSPEACLAELDLHGVPYRREPGEVDDVLTPVRLTGPVGGVTYRGLSRDRDSAFNILDCRFARMLVELSRVLRENGVTEVVYHSMHRPNHRGNPTGSGGSTGHRGGMAIDVSLLRTGDGRTVSVLRHFRGRRRAPVCGPKARKGATSETRLLRNIVCECNKRRLFHVLLTPNYDRVHRNHFHMEVRPDATRWAILR